MTAVSRSSDRIWTILLATLALLVWGGLAALRPGLETVWADEGTYLAMMASLAEDGDLLFGEPDRARLPDDPQDGRGTVILQHAAHGVSYSKPVLYPLLASPFYRFSPDWGPVLCNVMLLLLALVPARQYLHRLGTGERADLTWITFLLAGAALPYLLWRMGETLQLSLALAGMALALRSPGRRSWLGAFLLGILTVLRLPNGALAAVPVVAALLQRDRARAIRLAAASAAGALAILMLGSALTGSPLPYTADRATFSAQTGYPIEGQHPQFERGRATHERPALDPVRSTYAGFFFLVGRHTGVLFYLPILAVLALGSLRRGDRSGWVLVGGAAVMVGFYLLWMPGNYFGGSTFVGNRYLLPVYAALLAGPLRLPSRRALLGVWLVAGVVGGGALASVATSGELVDSQSHTRAGIFRLLPYESTAQWIDGRTDRYWSNDFVRFTGPGATVEPWSFVLPGDGSAVEMMVATRRARGPLRFQVTGAEGEVTIRLRDWLRSRSATVGPLSAGAAGWVELLPAPVWRHHPFWWKPGELYRVQVVRISAEGAGGAVRLRYVGDGSELERGYATEVLGAGWEGRPAVGAASPVWVRVENRSEIEWRSEATAPVVLAWRIFTSDGELISAEQLPLPKRVSPGKLLEHRFEVRWPQTPGRYRLEVDLVRDQVARFADRIGEPVASWWVKVEP